MLWMRMGEKSWAQQQLAEFLGVSRPSLSHWLYGTRRPGIQARMLIQKKLKIKWQAWDCQPLVAFIPPAGMAAGLPPTGTEGR